MLRLCFLSVSSPKHPFFPYPQNSQEDTRQWDQLPSTYVLFYSSSQRPFMSSFFSSYHWFPLHLFRFIQFIGCDFTYDDTELWSWPHSMHLCIFSANLNLKFIRGRDNILQSFILSSKSHMQCSVQSWRLCIWVDLRILYMKWMWV